MKTPLNYTGNKSRLVAEFSKHFPAQTGVFVDLFCGGATVGLSVNAKKVICIDNNPNVISLLKHLSENSFSDLLSRVEQIIKDYNLSYTYKYGYLKYRILKSAKDNNGFKNYNFEGYYKLRDAYNALPNKFSSQANDMLYVLIMYSFNNDMRFNKNGEFNLPVGKTDFNKSNFNKLQNFKTRMQEIDCTFICGDFRDYEVQKILFDADFIYADPPYLITNAVYNESGNWTETTEVQFLELLENLNRCGKKFAISNMLRKTGRENSFLNKWLFNRSDLHVVDIVYNYKSASYNKLLRDSNEQEVLIKNY